MSATIIDAMKAALLERGVDPADIKIRERVHIEKIDKTGPEPKLVEEVTIENGVIVQRQAY